MSAAVAADLRAAKDLLVADGWVRGEPRNPNGRCIVGAMQDATGGPTTGRYFPMRTALFAHLPSRECHLAAWNDAPGRTFAEVLALLDKAIAAEEARP